MGSANWAVEVLTYFPGPALVHSPFDSEQTESFFMVRRHQ